MPLVGGRPRFCLVALGWVGLKLGLAIGDRAIGGAVSTGGKVAVGLSGLSVWII